MSSKRFYFIMLGALGLTTLLVAGGVYLSLVLIDKKGSQLTDKKLENAVVELKQTDLIQAKRNVEELSELNELTKSIIPRDKNQSNTVVEINNLAKKAGVRLGFIEFPSSQLGSTTKPAPGKVADPSQLTAVKDLKGVYILPVTIGSHNDTPVLYSKLLKFLSLLENNRRTALVESITILPDGNNPNLVSFTITLNSYIKPETK